MSSVDMAPRSFAQEVHANFMESLMVMSRALSRPTMGAKELCSWSTLSTRLAKLLREEAIVMTRTGKLLLCIAFIWFSSINGGRNAVTSVPTLPVLSHQWCSKWQMQQCCMPASSLGPRAHGLPGSTSAFSSLFQSSFFDSSFDSTFELSVVVTGHKNGDDDEGEGACKLRRVATVWQSAAAPRT